jgi:hypothetical protein
MAVVDGLSKNESRIVHGFKQGIQFPLYLDPNLHATGDSVGRFLLAIYATIMAHENNPHI